jgi:probable F420-dependent oxidoreductase
MMKGKWEETNKMNFGAVYPQTEYPTDPVAIRDFTQTVEGLGYTHIVAYDHVLGANPDRPEGWQGPYTYQTTFMEVFILFSYMAAFSQKIGYLSGVLILPQRQTALVAKQAATLDVLCHGRFRLGVGLGWNHVEYEALNEDFHTRGKHVEEQVHLLRQLWTRPLVNFKGKWHIISDAGVNPLPIQRPIPIWFGGQADAMLRRVAAMGDGWLPNMRNAQDTLPALEKIDQYLEEAGRSRQNFGLEARLPFGKGDLDQLTHQVREWEGVGATHLSINTLNSGFDNPNEHLTALQTFARLVGIN